MKHIIEKIVHIPKKNWIIAHVLLLCIPVFLNIVSDISFGLTWDLIAETSFITVASILLFPISVFMIESVGAIADQFPFPIVVTFVVYGVTILYYLLWIRKDIRWEPEILLRIQYTRIIWFVVSVVTSLIVLSKLII